MKKVFLNIFVFLTFIIFFLGGINTFMGGARFADEFTRWGYPLGALVYVGSAEVVLALLLIPRSTRLVSAGLLFLISFLGLVKHVTSGDPFTIMIPGIVLVVLIGGIFALRKSV